MCWTNQSKWLILIEPTVPFHVTHNTTAENLISASCENDCWIFFSRGAVFLLLLPKWFQWNGLSMEVVSMCLS